MSLSGKQPLRQRSAAERRGTPFAMSFCRCIRLADDTRSADRFMLKAAASRLRLMERIQLSPEGFTLVEQVRLVRTLLARGQRIFNLSYHSPSLMPGGAPYVRDDDDLAHFLDRLEGLLDFFVNQAKGRFTTPLELKRRLDRSAVVPI